MKKWWISMSAREVSCRRECSQWVRVWRCSSQVKGGSGGVKVRMEREGRGYIARGDPWVERSTGRASGGRNGLGDPWGSKRGVRRFEFRREGWEVKVGGEGR